MRLRGNKEHIKAFLWANQEHIFEDDKKQPQKNGFPKPDKPYGKNDNRRKKRNSENNNLKTAWKYWEDPKAIREQSKETEQYTFKESKLQP